MCSNTIEKKDEKRDKNKERMRRLKRGNEKKTLCEAEEFTCVNE